MECLVSSLAPSDLSQFKYELEYDGDYKDLVEYLFHDIDNEDIRSRIIDHFRKSGLHGVKVLTDVDDTMYSNLLEKRYPHKELYPGVLEFYDALKDEPVAAADSGTPITTLSARPDPIAGKLEQQSLDALKELTKNTKKLRPSALSGALKSSAAGTLQSVLRANQTSLDLVFDELPHGQEDKIGEVKFQNFADFARVYPEYRYVFVGDSGQADALTAQLMLTNRQFPEETARVVTTFIHDLRRSANDEMSTSAAFRNLLQSHPDLLITETSANGRGVVIFKDYIEAAAIAYKHKERLGDLITAEELATVTKAALEQFEENSKRNDFDKTSRERLGIQYKVNAQNVYQQLVNVSPEPAEHILTILRRAFWQGLAVK